MSSNKIALILDTNILMKNIKEKERLDTFSLELYDYTVDMIERNDLIDKVTIFIPEIVFLELSKHKFDKLDDRIKNLRNFSEELSSIEGIQINLDDKLDIEKHFENIRKSKLDEIKIINIPQDKSNLFDKILDMSLHKIAPFEENASDKGFKDAIIILSLVDFAKKSEYSKFVLFTKDKGAFIKNAQKVKQFFKDETSKDLDIIDNKDVQGYISNNFNLFIGFKKYLNEKFYPQLDEVIKQKRNIVLKDKGIVCEIKEFTIDDENTILEEILEDKFSLKIGFYIICSDRDGNKITIDDIQNEYSFEKDENGEWIEEEKEFNYLVY